MIDERVTNWIAGGAAINILWMPSFHETLQILLTILGIVYLGIQIYYRLKKGE